MDSIPHLLIRLPAGQVERVPLDADLFAIGRDVGSQYRVPDDLKFVARELAAHYGRKLEIQAAA